MQISNYHDATFLNFYKLSSIPAKLWEVMKVFVEHKVNDGDSKVDICVNEKKKD